MQAVPRLCCPSASCLGWTRVGACGCVFFMFAAVYLVLNDAITVRSPGLLSVDIWVTFCVFAAINNISMNILELVHDRLL